MGKRKRSQHANFTGLSRFAHEMFVDHSESRQPQTSSHDVKETPPKTSEGYVNKLGGLNYDASHLVPHYNDASEVPAHLQKYFSQRKRYFSLYDKGCLLDEEGWYSVTPERIADQIAERCRCDTVLDAFCGVGGNAIALAKTCERVIAMDISPTRLALARHNAIIYGVADRIEFILADYLSFARAYLTLPLHQRKIDVIFLSPPWGGPSYLSPSISEDLYKPHESLEHGQDVHPEYSLANIQPVHGSVLFELSRRITGNIAFFLPRNTRLEDVSALLEHSVSIDDQKSDGEQPREFVEVEEEWMGSKLKALTCYFGGLVDGQEDMF